MTIQHTQQPITTGATVVGVKYRDGIMLAADTMVAYGSSLRFKDNTRISIAGKHTLIGASGEYADFQAIGDMMEEVDREDWQEQDGKRLGPSEVASYLGRVLYNRRSKQDPLWNQLVIGGVKNGKKTLAYVDLQGTCFEEDYLATGFGMHLAIPILRSGWKADLSEKEAKDLLKQCLELCFYRDCKASAKIQYALVTESQGPKIEEPFVMDTFWAHKQWTKTGKEISSGASW